MLFATHTVGLFPQGLSGRSVSWSTNLYLMLKLRVNGPFFSLYVVMEWTRTALLCVGKKLSVRGDHTLKCSENYLHMRNKKKQRNYILRSFTVELMEEIRSTEFGWKSRNGGNYMLEL